jgi:hypothetical protein
MNERKVLKRINSFFSLKKLISFSILIPIIFSFFFILHSECLSLKFNSAQDIFSIQEVVALVTGGIIFLIKTVFRNIEDGKNFFLTLDEKIISIVINAEKELKIIGISKEKKKKIIKEVSSSLIEGDKTKEEEELQRVKELNKEIGALTKTGFLVISLVALVLMFSAAFFYSKKDKLFNFLVSSIIGFENVFIFLWVIKLLISYEEIERTTEELETEIRNKAKEQLSQKYKEIEKELGESSKIIEEEIKKEMLSY